MVIVAGAPYYDLAKEREGAPSYLPRCSCPFFIIYPSFSVSVLTWCQHQILTSGRVPASTFALLIHAELAKATDKDVLTGCQLGLDGFKEVLHQFCRLVPYYSK